MSGAAGLGPSLGLIRKDRLVCGLQCSFTCLQSPLQNTASWKWTSSPKWCKAVTFAPGPACGSSGDRAATTIGERGPAAGGRSVEGVAGQPPGRLWRGPARRRACGAGGHCRSLPLSVGGSPPDHFPQMSPGPVPGRKGRAARGSPSSPRPAMGRCERRLCNGNSSIWPAQNQSFWLELRPSIRVPTFGEKWSLLEQRGRDRRGETEKSAPLNVRVRSLRGDSQHHSPRRATRFPHPPLPSLSLGAPIPSPELSRPRSAPTFRNAGPGPGSQAGVEGDPSAQRSNDRQGRGTAAPSGPRPGGNFCRKWPDAFYLTWHNRQMLASQQ
ncbi:PREDICTED: uncharacterized protein LOC108536311 [Rhinopithecus bieti]|uniref:uncharacterized protein LOC108536311 n=1 Tax=Rhinopithecus bieti TaxID=61621 RepID=UPI00083BE2A3|nr:PREDICTED: uncharacterized protein LOC108536311 [Rhinopithecus bieti]